MKDGKKEQILNSVLRTFDVVELLARRGELGVTRIAQEAGLDKSSVYRILATLKSIGYVCQNPATQGYANTSRFASLCPHAPDTGELRERTRPFLSRLAEETGETASLGILEGRDILYIDTVQCSEMIRVNLPIGQKLPAYCSALGKAILAFLPEERVRELFGGSSLEKFTPNTLSSYGALAEELVEAKALGFARDREESHRELACLGVPVFGADGRIVAGISLSYPCFRHPDQALAEQLLLPRLREAGIAVSLALGFRAAYPGTPENRTAKGQSANHPSKE
ncbi:MAG: IclR family transcriptional regulator [Synergistaceae bacterium]|jgi:DNA-binding IclR family transcriptional regulator|nr:IclR family transcriptional regulator [Synergistaceae bacterium]